MGVNWMGLKFRVKNLIRNLNYLSKVSLWDQREKDIVYVTNKIIDDVSYEYDISYPNQKKLQIYSTDETLKILETTEKSFIRTGDGEIAIMQGRHHSFQKYNKEIANRLLSALRNPPENLLVGINLGYFSSLNELNNHFYYRRNAYEYREFYRKHCSSDITYIDASCIGPLRFLENKDLLLAHYDRWRKIFENKKLVIVCGHGLLNEYKYNVFELAESMRVIDAPRRNAWDEHDRIIETIKNTVTIDEIIVFILGQAGKAMITELVEDGYICWDVGHLAKYYNSIMQGDDCQRESFFAPD